MVRSEKGLFRNAKIELRATRNYCEIREKLRAIPLVAYRYCGKKNAALLRYSQAEYRNAAMRNNAAEYCRNKRYALR